MRKALWIHKSSHVLEVNQTHVAEVCRQPQLFGLTKEQVTAEYQRFDEPVGCEAEAGNELMCQVIRQGWIRARQWKDSLIVTVNSDRQITPGHRQALKQHFHGFTAIFQPLNGNGWQEKI